MLQSLRTFTEGDVVSGVIIDPTVGKILHGQSRERPSFGPTQVRDASELALNRSFLEHFWCRAEVRVSTGKCESGCTRERIRIKQAPTREGKGASRQSFVIVSLDMDAHGYGWELYLDSVSIEPGYGGSWCTTQWLERISS